MPQETRTSPAQAAIPSVDRILRDPACDVLVVRFGRRPVTEAVRGDVAALRGRLAEGGREAAEVGAIVARVAAALERAAQPSLRPVWNLTGTVLHTNLGRAPLPPEAIEAVVAVAGGASNLEYDLATGKRGDRDVHLDDLVCRLTGAEAATVVNNNAAAVLLTLNTLAQRKEVLVSRGELIEIGGAFRIPDIMARAGAKLHEVGTTNRTHEKDFLDSITPRTALVMKVHASNYEISGFTKSVPERELAAIAHGAGLPFAVDLGSGTLVDLAQYGLPHEPTAAETIASGADIVTFSGDKLLGGPQAGLIAGRADLIARIRKNPMKRAMRCDKMTIAALAAVLRLYDDPDRLAERVPTLRLLARPRAEIEAAAQRLLPAMRAAAGEGFAVGVAPCRSQIGSGSLPAERLDSAALVLRPAAARGAGTALVRLAAAFRALPVPVIGRVQDDAFRLDLRCLEPEGEAAFAAQLPALALRP
ncbi:MAG: L-seryl-tRNA(Sec) selenium transferase [Alphaproteobacteria bacterium]|nr:L-seryl-tRNA(Sec) selenium transferase [Alphaproteobacteria bacterium]